MDAIGILAAAYRLLLDLTAELTDDTVGWTATALPGWTVRDLVYHLATDAQRALVALARPTSDPCDTDEITYWQHWRPGTDGADRNRRAVRTFASVWSSVRGPARLHVETATAVLALAGRSEPTDAVTTQGHTLTVDALLRTLAVEAAVHHLDLGPVLPAPPDPVVLAEVRRTLDGLLGEPAPPEWDDLRYLLIGTERAEPTGEERAALGERAGDLPLFG